MDLLTIPETARLLKVTPITVRRYIAAGRLPAVRVGKGIRVRKEAVDDLITPVTPKSGVQGWIDQEQGGGMQHTEQAIVPRRLTAEERARGLAAVHELRRLHAAMRAERGGQSGPSSLELLDEARVQRSRELS